MGTIDTISWREQPITIGACTYSTLDKVSVRVWLTVAVAIIVAKLETRRTRIHLSQLDDFQLRDIGVNRQQADQEIGKSLMFYKRPTD